MSFERLPVELLSIILDYVGPFEFRARIDRLTINKRWYKSAQSVLLSDVQVSVQRYHCFPPKRDTTSQVLRSSLTRLSISIPTWFNIFRGTFRCSPGADTQTRRQEVFDHRRAALNAWILAVSDFTQQCRALKTIELSTQIDWEFYDTTLDFHPVESLISRSSSTSFLSELSLDTFCLWPRGTRGLTGEPRGHICPIIADQLPTLRRLKLCLGMVCPRLLDLSSHGGSAVPLRELEVSLSKTGEGAYLWTRCCPHYNDQSYSILLRLMVDAVERFVQQAPNIEIARVLCHRLPDGALQIADCLGDKRKLIHRDGRVEDMGTSDD